MSEATDSNPNLKLVRIVEETTSQENVPTDDTAKLRSLGYDAVLGRPLGFWSALGLNVCHMGFIVEANSQVVLFAYSAPKLFMIGYPILLLLHLTLVSTFSEFVSAYPVAGAMATWAWRAAKAGVKHERQWGWLVSGLVLAAQIGKSIGVLYWVSEGTVQIYLMIAEIPMDISTMEAIEPKAWRMPVFLFALVTLVAILLFTRVARHHRFWVFCMVFNIYMGLFMLTLYIKCLYTIRKMPNMDVNWGFPQRKTWTHNFSYVLFLLLPFRLVSIDAPAHMAEETRNPQKTVPRVMYTTVIFNFIFSYVLAVVYIFGAAPYAKGLLGISPVLPVQMILQMKRPLLITFGLSGILSTFMQGLACVVVTSRFTFALARDYGVPFATTLFKTNRWQEPWVSDLVVVMCLYASIAGLYVPKNIWDNLTQTLMMWYMPVVYALTLILYLFSNLDLASEGRSVFTLRRWSKPFALFNVLWLTVACIQGCFPYAQWLNSGTVGIPPLKVSTFPLFCIGMVLIMIITWYLYGKKHYIGPIRALTKWSAGVEINPLDPHNFKTSVGRRNAIFEYMKGVMSVASDNSYTYAKTGETSGSSWTTSIKKWTKFSALFSKPASETVFVDDGAGEGVNAQTTQALPESGLLPQTHVGTVAPTMAALDESVLLPGTRVSFDSSIAHTESEVGTTTTFGRTSVGQTDTFGAPTQHRARGPVAPRARVHRDHRAAASVTDTMPAIDESQLDPTATRDYDLFPSNSRW